METKLSSNLSHEKIDELQSELYIAHKQLEQQKKIVAKYRELKAKEKDPDAVCMYVCIYVCVLFDSYLVYLCICLHALVHMHYYHLKVHWKIKGAYCKILRL